MADGSGPEALYQEAEQLREQLTMVSRQLDLLADLKEDKSRAHTTLLGVKEAKAGDEILFPVGGNTFVTATLGENHQVVKGVGAEYAMERPLDKAIEELKAEMDTLDSDVQNLSRTAEQLESRYAQVSEVLQRAGMGGIPQSQ